MSSGIEGEMVVGGEVGKSGVVVEGGAKTASAAEEVVKGKSWIAKEIAAWETAFRYAVWMQMWARIMGGNAGMWP